MIYLTPKVSQNLLGKHQTVLSKEDYASSYLEENRYSCIILFVIFNIAVMDLDGN